MLDDIVAVGIVDLLIHQKHFLVFDAHFAKHFITSCRHTYRFINPSTDHLL